MITGATFGIGYELSKIFAGNGYNLVLTARNRSQLEERKTELESTYGIAVTVIDMDLSVPGSGEKFYEKVSALNIAIAVLVNNAGFGQLGKFAALDLSTQQQMIELNITSVTVLTHRFLQDMQARGSGRIMNVASTASFQPGPLMAVYYATKAFVLYLTEALAVELVGSNITVSVLCPGPTISSFQERAGFRSNLLMKNSMSAAAVARIGYRGLMNGKTVIITGWLNRLMAQSNRLMPRKWIQNVVYWISKNR